MDLNIVDVSGKNMDGDNNNESDSDGKTGNEQACEEQDTGAEIKKFQ